MGAFYIMRYLGSADVGWGGIAIANGKIAGADVGNCRYVGSYTERGGRLKGSITLTATQPVHLVTGVTLQAGQSLKLDLEWPANFDDGSAQQVSIFGHIVQVTFEKVGDLS